eukprot:01369_5
MRRECVGVCCVGRDFSVCLVASGVIARNSDLEFLRSTKPQVLPQLSAYVVSCVPTDEWWVGRLEGCCSASSPPTSIDSAYFYRHSLFVLVFPNTRKS